MAPAGTVVAVARVVPVAMGVPAALLPVAPQVLMVQVEPEVPGGLPETLATAAEVAPVRAAEAIPSLVQAVMVVREGIAALLVAVGQAAWALTTFTLRMARLELPQPPVVMAVTLAMAAQVKQPGRLAARAEMEEPGAVSAALPVREATAAAGHTTLKRPALAVPAVTAETVAMA